MFYAHFVLSKKGPLARIWLAAHWDKKLTRAHVFETNISSSVEAILEPKVKLALRTSGHLLLGVVRIYSRQAKYLLADCNEAFVKIKMAFRPGAEVQEEAHRDTCSLAAITLADNMHDFESTLAELTEMDPYSISVNQSRPEDITMREEFGEPNLGRPDDDFGDSTFEEGGEREYGVDHSAVDVMEMDEHHEDLANELVRSQPSQVYAEMPPSVSMASNDEFCDMMDVDYDSGENLDRNMEEAVMFQDNTNEKIVDSFSRIESDLADTTMETTMEPMEVIEPSVVTLPCVPEEEGSGVSNEHVVAQEQHVLASLAQAVPQSEAVSLAPPSQIIVQPIVSPALATPTITATTTNIFTVPNIATTTTVTTTPNVAAKRLPQFVLPPVTQASRIDHRRTPKRKRRLLIDEHKSIPSDVMKMQMQDTSEITTRLDLAPPTRKLMLWKETGSVDSLFTTPGRAIPSRVLQRLFYRNLKTVPVANDSPDGLPVYRTCKVNNVSVDRAVLDQPLVDQLERFDEQLDDHRRQQQQLRQEEREKEQRDLYSIVEMQENNHHQVSNDQNMPPGACSSYSANYDCFSGQPTPRRDHEEHEEDEDGQQQMQLQLQSELQARLQAELQSQIQAQHSTEDHLNEGQAGILNIEDGLKRGQMSMAVRSVGQEEQGHEEDTERTGQEGDIDVLCTRGVEEQHSMYSQIPIEEVRMSVLLSDTSEAMMAFSNDGFDTTFNDRSIISAVNDSTVLDCTGNVVTAVSRSMDHMENNNGIRVGPDGGHDKLQNTMLALDNELDIIDRQFPIEMTQEGLEKRSEIMLNVLQDAMKRDNQVVFQHLTVSNNKKQAASKFYTLLLLGKQKAITLHQETPFSNIIITPYSR